MKKIIYPLLAASLALAACTPDVKPLSFTAPVVEFAQTEATLSVSVGEPFTFRADIVEGDGLTVGWYVNGVLESSNGTLEYTWHEPGTYKVDFSASNGAGSVAKAYTVNVSDKLDIFISSESVYEIADGGKIECLEQSYLAVYAVVVEGSNVRHEWSVDGTVQDCSEAYFNTYWLPAGKGTHAIKYKGSNAVGSVEYGFTVDVQERPLTVSFSNEASTIACLVGTTVEITATVDYGGTGAEHSWTVDDEVVSDGLVFSKRFDTAGSYTLTYKGVNEKGDEAERTWTINVSSREEVLLEDYENGSSNGVIVHQGSGAAVSIVDNPSPDAVNGSAKVMAATGNSGSGYMGLMYDAIEKLGIDPTQYDGIKVDLYIPSSPYPFYPAMDQKDGNPYVYANGFDKNADDDAPYAWDKWITVDYDLPLLKEKHQIQPRAFCGDNSNGKGTNGSVVYYDNVYLYKK